MKIQNMEGDMNDFEIVKKIIFETSKKYLVSFNLGIDNAWCNIQNEAFNRLICEYPNKPDFIYMFHAIFFYLQKDISEYAVSMFNNENIEKVINQISIDNKKVFDEMFIINLTVRRANGCWI
jgi:hypothetical protein